LDTVVYILDEFILLASIAPMRMLQFLHYVLLIYKPGTLIKQEIVGK